MSSLSMSACLPNYMRNFGKRSLIYNFQGKKLSRRLEIP